jgi:uncharacterized membrane protein YgcG
MKKIISFILSLIFASSILLAFAGTSFAASKTGYPQIVDYTGTLSDSEIEDFEKRLISLRDEFSYDAVVVLINNDTVSEMGISSLEVFADDLYDNSGYGVGEYNDGILVLLRFGEPYSNHFHLCTTGSLVQACTEEDIDDMYYSVRPYLTSENVRGAVDETISAERSFFETVNRRAEEEAEAAGFHPVKKAVISLAVGFLIAFISVMTMKGKLTSVGKKNQAADYVVPGSFNLRESRDLFLYANVTKTPIPQNNSSRGGGGAGAHFSSSGVSHGGGTR